MDGPLEKILSIDSLYAELCLHSIYNVKFCFSKLGLMSKDSRIILTSEIVSAQLLYVSEKTWLREAWRSVWDATSALAENTNWVQLTFPIDILLITQDNDGSGLGQITSVCGAMGGRQVLFYHSECFHCRVGIFTGAAHKGFKQFIWKCPAPSGAERHNVC